MLRWAQRTTSASITHATGQCASSGRSRWTSPTVRRREIYPIRRAKTRKDLSRHIIQGIELEVCRCMWIFCGYPICCVPWSRIYAICGLPIVCLELQVLKKKKAHWGLSLNLELWHWLMLFWKIANWYSRHLHKRRVKKHLLGKHVLSLTTSSLAISSNWVQTQA